MRPGLDDRVARWVRIRIALVGLVLAAASITVAGRAVQLQVVQKDRLGALARDQYVREIELKPRRGAITDRNGVVLAADAEADSVYVDPQELSANPQRASAISRLARILSLDAHALARRLSRDGHFVWVKRRVSPREAEAVHALALAGVGLVKETRRYYPRRELAAQILGFVGDDGVGLEGIELALDDALQGEPMWVPSLRDARGMHLFDDAPAPERVLEGARVELTIDQGLQRLAERALSHAVAQARAASGMAVALDPGTGEVLALANAPSFNPNAPRRGDGLRNRAVLDTFEPGSTFKVFALAGALDAGVLRPRDAIFCENGRWAVGTHVIHDHKPIGWVGPGRILIVSSNIGAAKIATRLGRERLQRTLLAFGFGERAGIGVPAEPKGQVPYPRADISLANMAFGQGVTASALQISTAMAAIANGGTLLRPWLVRRVVDPARGRVLMEATPIPIRRAVAPEAAATVARWLEGVVSNPDGTGKKARLDGYRVAGKTGTAQKADPVSGGYSSDKRFSSFVGFAPAESPRIVIGVFVDEPKGDAYGGDVAAPVFREIADYAMKSLGVRPSGPLAAAPANGEASDRVDFEDPSHQAAGAQAAEPLVAASPGTVAVPSLERLPARAAIRALEALDLLGDVRGSGRVAAQTPRAGEVVERGAKVHLTLSPSG